MVMEEWLFGRAIARVSWARESENMAHKGGDLAELEEMGLVRWGAYKKSGDLFLGGTWATANLLPTRNVTR